MSFPLYTGNITMSKPAPYQPTSPALVALVERAINAYPGEETRIRRGAEIVERDGVRVRKDGVYEVGIHRYYEINGHCECPDATLRHAPKGKCKHRYAKTFYRKLHAASAPTVRTKTFVASLDDTCGLATICEDGRAHFTPHDATLAPWVLSDYEIAYTMVLGRELST